MSLITWPAQTLAPQSVLFSRQSASRSGGPSVLGVEQIVASSSDRWRAKITTKITTQDQALTFRSLMAQSDGRSNVWFISPCAGVPSFTVPPAFVGEFLTGFSDGAHFSDSTRFFTNVPLTLSLSQGFANGNLSAGARVMPISANDLTPPPAGQYFTVRGRLYEIALVQRTGVGAFDIAFRPGLRTSVAVGDVLDFRTPGCPMRLASDDTGQMDLDLLRFATVSLDFVEAA